MNDEFLKGVSNFLVGGPHPMALRWCNPSNKTIKPLWITFQMPLLVFQQFTTFSLENGVSLATFEGERVNTIRRGTDLERQKNNRFS